MDKGREDGWVRRPTRPRQAAGRTVQGGLCRNLQRTIRRRRANGRWHAPTTTAESRSCSGCSATCDGRTGTPADPGRGRAQGGRKMGHGVALQISPGLSMLSQVSLLRWMPGSVSTENKISIFLDRACSFCAYCRKWRNLTESIDGHGRQTEG